MHLQQLWTGSCACTGKSQPASAMLYCCALYFLSIMMNHSTAQLLCKKKKQPKPKHNPKNQSLSEVKLTCHQDHKPPTIQINCTAFWQVGKATNSPTQLNLAHALRLLLWAAASKAEWHSPASKLLGHIIPGRSLASPCHQHMPTHTCTNSR